MDTLRVDTAIAGPALEFPAARPAPAARPVPARSPEAETTNGPDSAPRRPRSDVEPSDGRHETGRSGATNGSDDTEVRAALRETAEELKRELKTLGGHSLDISFEEENRRYVVQIRDSESGELIRQIPPEHLLEASRRLNELRGLLFDDWS